MVAERLGLWRLRDFELTRLHSATDVHLFHAQGRNVPEDRRLIVTGDVRDLTVLRDDDGNVRALPQVEAVLDAGLDSLRSVRAADSDLAGLRWNRVLLYVWPVVEVPLTELDGIVRTLAPRTDALGIEQVMVRFRSRDGAPDDPSAPTHDYVLRMTRPPGAGLTLRVTEPPSHPMAELDAYTQKVIKAGGAARSTPTSSSRWSRATPTPTAGRHVHRVRHRPETLRPVPVDRPYGANTANIVLGMVTTPTRRQPEGMTRVAAARRPDAGARAPSPSRSAGASSPRSTSPASAACPSSGTPSRPAPRSRWTPAPRTWTGSPGCSGRSSRSPRTAARSTSSSRASTSAPSRTGTPRRRCSCTPAASSS